MNPYPNAPDAPNFTSCIPGWALTDEILVTVTDPTTQLIQRVYAPGAFVFAYNEDGQAFVNGVPTDTHAPAFEALCDRTEYAPMGEYGTPNGLYAGLSFRVLATRPARP
jgi:hypothetical protein